jgi:splicing suppressor protein 51
MAIMAAVAQHVFGNASSSGGNAIPSGRNASSSGGNASSSGGTASFSSGNASSSSGNASSSTAQDTQEFNPGDQGTKPYTAISKNLFFHDRLESNTFQLLIDTLRMRQQDELNFDRVRMPGSIHARNESSSEKAFRDFILKAQGVPGYLPTWWKGEISTDACVEYAQRNAAFSLAVAQEKQDIQRTWDEDRMPMMLRMVAERVYGNTPGGFKSDTVLAMMVAQENGGGGVAQHVDVAGLARGAR